LIRESLPPGWRKSISGVFGVTSKYVSAVLHGRRFNNDILRKAVEMALAHKKDIQYIREKVSELYQ
jgi:hypothetical protein